MVRKSLKTNRKHKITKKATVHFTYNMATTTIVGKMA